MNIEKTHIKFTQMIDTGEVIGFVSRNSKIGLLRGVLESSDYKKKVCVLSKDLKGTVEPNVLYDVELKPMLSGNGYVVISAERTLFDAEFKTTRVPNKVYRIDISFGNKTIHFDPKDGDILSTKTVEAVYSAIGKRKDLLQKEDVKSRFVREAKNLTLHMENDCKSDDSCLVEPVKSESIVSRLKKKMSYQEMEDHMRKNSWKNVNKVTVGLYAKRLGYEVYKPMINGRICHFYVNRYIEESGL